MSFIAKNPLSAAKLESSPPSPIEGARGLFPKKDGWYDINDDGKIIKLITEQELNNVSQGATITIEESTDSDVAKIYSIIQNGTVIGSINIPVDMVVSSGSIETFAEENLPDNIEVAGTYIVLTIANSEADKLYININDLVEINEIADDLVTDDSNKVLSAKQGKILNDTLELKEDKTMILTDVESTDVVIESLPHNTENRYGELISISVALPIDTNEDYISSVVFSTPSEIPENYSTFPSSVYFKGDECDGGIFVPNFSTRYTILFYYDGEFIVGLVSGIEVQ